MTIDALVLKDVALVLGQARLLDGLSLRIAAGERVAVVGESGCGKSLIGRLAAGLVAPTQGRVALFGENVAELSPDTLRRLRARCGIALQGGSLFGDLVVEDNLRLAFGGQRSGAARVDRRVNRLLMDFHLEHLGSTPIAGLSVGEQRRVELARAFVRDPDLVILDDPIEGARGDAPAIEQQVLRQVRGRGRAMLLLTQDAALAARLAETVYRLERGRLVVQQVPARSLSDAAS